MTKPTPTITADTTSTPQIGRRRALALSSGVVIGSIGLVASIGGGQASAIVDGEQTTVTANPWQAALTTSDGEQVCGGSVVSDRVIVTAAHCTQGTPADAMQIRVGVTDLSTDDGQTRNITKVIEHPKYVDGVGDIAMLVLDRPLEFSANVAPIELAETSDIAAVSSARVTGWGATSEDADDSPSVLRGTDVPLVSDADCGLIDVGNDDELCAGGTGTDSCYGDSGGPLTVATNDGQKLAGVVSWGDECGGESAGVYAEVPTFATWVAERIADPDAPAGDRLPALDDEAFGENDGDDGYIDIDEQFFDEYTDEELDAMSDEEFWEAVEPYVTDASDDDSDDAASTSDDQVTSDGSMTDAEFDEMIDAMTDAEFDEYLDGFDEDTAAQEFPGGFDVNGDDIVQWSEFDPAGAKMLDANGDGIVNWSELLDA